VFTAIAWWALSPVRFEPPIALEAASKARDAIPPADVSQTAPPPRETLVP
jgi:hypothetical protein